MKRILILILPILLNSCENGGQLKSDPIFLSSDSTETVKFIFDSLRAEMYLQWFMEPTHSKYICYESPSFNPRIQIIINKKGEIMANYEVNPKSISELIVQFYSANLYKNEISNNFPFYSELTKKFLLSEIRELEAELDTIKKAHNVNQELIDFQQLVIGNWKSKLKVFSILSVDKIREPDYSAGIELKYPEKCKTNEVVLDSILLGFYRIREKDAKMYFNESYAKIFWKATKHKDSTAINKLNVFKTLHPIRVLDYGKSRYRPKMEIPPVLIE